mgnify:CR=1 FL=1
MKNHFIDNILKKARKFKLINLAKDQYFSPLNMYTLVKILKTITNKKKV